MPIPDDGPFRSARLRGGAFGGGPTAATASLGRVSILAPMTVAVALLVSMILFVWLLSLWLWWWWWWERRRMVIFRCRCRHCRHCCGLKKIIIVIIKIIFWWMPGGNNFVGSMLGRRKCGAGYRGRIVITAIAAAIPIIRTTNSSSGSTTTSSSGRRRRSIHECRWHWFAEQRHASMQAKALDCRRQYVFVSGFFASRPTRTSKQANKQTNKQQPPCQFRPLNQSINLSVWRRSIREIERQTERGDEETLWWGRIEGVGGTRLVGRWNRRVRRGGRSVMTSL